MSKESSLNIPLLFIGQTKIRKDKFPQEMLEMKANESSYLQHLMPVFKE
jgi:hypothetical protein